MRSDSEGEEEEAVALENRAGDFAVDGSDEAEGAGAEAEGASVALEVVVGEGDGFGTEREVAEGGIGAVGVGLRAGQGRDEKDGDETQECARHGGSQGCELNRCIWRLRQHGNDDEREKVSMSNGDARGKEVNEFQSVTVNKRPTS